MPPERRIFRDVYDGNVFNLSWNPDGKNEVELTADEALVVVLARSFQAIVDQLSEIAAAIPSTRNE